MTPLEAVAPVADDKDFGLAGHLAAIEQMHREALAQVEALGKPWANLWSTGSAAATSETAEQPVTGQPPVRAAA